MGESGLAKNESGMYILENNTGAGGGGGGGGIFDQWGNYYNSLEEFENYYNNQVNQRNQQIIDLQRGNDNENNDGGGGGNEQETPVGYPGGGFEFTMPAVPEAEGPSYEEQLEDAERIRSENERTSLYTEYLDSAETAIDYVNGMIDEELSQAALYGEEIEITEEQKNKRISDYFAGIWGEGQQQRLETLIDEYGEPENFDGFFLTRGTAEDDEEEEGDETAVAKSRGQVPTTATLLTGEEDDLGGNKTILG